MVQEVEDQRVEDLERGVADSAAISPLGGRVRRRSIRLQRIGLALVLLGCALQAVLLFRPLLSEG